MQDYGDAHTIIFSILNNKQFNPVNLLKSAWQTSMPRILFGHFDGKYLLCFYFSAQIAYSFLCVCAFMCFNELNALYECSFHDNMLICFVQICLAHIVVVDVDCSYCC